jgi:hypothetical protein
MELEWFICAIEGGFRGMLVDLMEFLFGSAGSGFVVSCVVRCRRLVVEMWMKTHPHLYDFLI